MRDPTIYRIKHVTHHRQGDKWSSTRCLRPRPSHPGRHRGASPSACAAWSLRTTARCTIGSSGTCSARNSPKQREFARPERDQHRHEQALPARTGGEAHRGRLGRPLACPPCPACAAAATPPPASSPLLRRPGISKADNLVDMRQLEAMLRAELELNAQRRGCAGPHQVIIDNYPADRCEMFDLPNPNREVNDTTTRPVAFLPRSCGSSAATSLRYRRRSSSA